MMKQFLFFNQEKKKELFYKEPQSFSKYSDRGVLAYALGGILYMPGTRETIAEEILNHKYLVGRHEGLTSLVICLEDAITDNVVNFAFENIVRQLVILHDAIASGEFQMQNLPLIFIRVRSGQQVKDLVAEIGEAKDVLTGFNFPKFDPETGPAFIEALKEVNKVDLFYGMPILESSEILFKETRIDSMLKVKQMLDECADLILNVRMGATDFSSKFGIRRNSETTIYEVTVIRDCIADIVNFFGRAEGGYVISGPVWEFFGSKKRVLKPDLRKSPYEKFGERGRQMRREILARFEDSLIREIILDKANGLTGKTIIHPSHIKVVQALSTVSYEEYCDALAIITAEENGVIRSLFNNKMNEVKPHTNWAKKVINQSTIFGVLHEQKTYVDLLEHATE